MRNSYIFQMALPMNFVLQPESWHLRIMISPRLSNLKQVIFTEISQQHSQQPIIIPAHR